MCLLRQWVQYTDTDMSGPTQPTGPLSFTKSLIGDPSIYADAAKHGDIKAVVEHCSFPTPPSETACSWQIMSSAEGHGCLHLDISSGGASEPDFLGAMCAWEPFILNWIVLWKLEQSGLFCYPAEKMFCRRNWILCLKNKDDLWIICYLDSECSQCHLRQ